MAKVVVRLPLGVSLPGMPAFMECQGATVADVLADCVAQESRLRGRVFRQDGTLWVGVSINGSGVPQETARDAVLQNGDVIGLVPAVGAC
jgi:sulfur carrier protein ThiS